MEKAKSKTKVAAILLALVIIFIPFGSAFAAPRPRVSNLGVDDGLNGAVKTYTNHEGTYYVRQGYSFAFLKGDILNSGSSFTIKVEVRNGDTGAVVRKVSERISVPAGTTSLNIQDFCNISTRYGNRSRYCSQNLTASLDLSTLPVGYYSCSFHINDSSEGTVVYVKVYSGDVEDFVSYAYRVFDLPYRIQDFDVDMYKLSKWQMKGTDFLWNLYVQNQAKGLFTGHSSRYVIRTVGYIAYGRYPTSSEEQVLVMYCSNMGLPLTIKQIIYSGKAKNHIMDYGMKV